MKCEIEIDIKTKIEIETEIQIEIEMRNENTKRNAGNQWASDGGNQRAGEMWGNHWGRSLNFPRVLTSMPGGITGVG